jgi:hypothetical protein
MRRLILAMLLPILPGCQSLGVIDLAARAIEKCAIVHTINTRGGRWYESPDFSTSCHHPAEITHRQPPEVRYVPIP